MQLSALNIHPLKSGRAIPLDRSALTLEGLANDRCWMLVDEAGRFVSQREEPRLALLDARPDGDGLHLSFEEPDGTGGTDGGKTGAADGGERFVAFPDPADRLPVTIWTDRVEAALAPEADNAAVSRWLGRPLRLVFFDRLSRRTVSRDWLDRDAPVGFTDGFPLLVVVEESLRQLNRAIVSQGGEAVPMSRFRPNLVISGAQAFEDDLWRTIRVGGVTIDLVKPCARCVVTTVDQASGVPEGPEPIQTLRTLRFSADRRVPGVLFGWNAVPRGPGQLAVGDAVEVLERREEGWPLRQAAR